MAMAFIDFSDEYEGNDILTLFLQYTFGRRTTFLFQYSTGNCSLVNGKEMKIRPRGVSLVTNYIWATILLVYFFVWTILGRPF
jgi:hypothetical protein